MTDKTIKTLQFLTESQGEVYMRFSQTDWSISLRLSINEIHNDGHFEETYLEFSRDEWLDFIEQLKQLPVPGQRPW